MQQKNQNINTLIIINLTSKTNLGVKSVLQNIHEDKCTAKLERGISEYEIYEKRMHLL